MRGRFKHRMSKLFLAAGRRLRPDGAAFIGAIICVISLFFPWVARDLSFLRGVTPPAGGSDWYQVIGRIKIEWSFIDLILEPSFTVVLLILLTGIVLSLFHRSGVILQAAGLLGFAFAAHSHFVPSLTSFVFSPANNEYSFGPGYFIAVFGVFISMFAAKNFWWQRETHSVVPTISRVTALSPNSTRTSR